MLTIFESFDVRKFFFGGYFRNFTSGRSNLFFCALQGRYILETCNYFRPILWVLHNFLNFEKFQKICFSIFRIFSSAMTPVKLCRIYCVYYQTNTSLLVGVEWLRMVHILLFFFFFFFLGIRWGVNFKISPPQWL